MVSEQWLQIASADEWVYGLKFTALYGFYSGDLVGTTLAPREFELWAIRSDYSYTKAHMICYNMANGVISQNLNGMTRYFIALGTA